MKAKNNDISRVLFRFATPPTHLRREQRVREKACFRKCFLNDSFSVKYRNLFIEHLIRDCSRILIYDTFQFSKLQISFVISCEMSPR